MPRKIPIQKTPADRICRQASAAPFGAPKKTWHGLGDPMQLVALVRAMRPHQWVKNLLLFVPLVTAHRIADIQAWTHALQAFLAMCLTAGAIYIANDLSDLDADRAHRSKSRRPFASGSLPIWAGVSCVPLLLGGAWLIALTLPDRFLGWMGPYSPPPPSYPRRLPLIT